MTSVRQPRLQKALPRYALAVVAVGLATTLTRWLAGVGDTGFAALFFAAVVCSAWYGGMGPGLVATLLSGLATEYLLLTLRAWSVHAIADHIIRLMVFTFVSILTSSLHSAMRTAAVQSRRAMDAAESASAAKSRFLAMVSHELRTPLSPVLMLTEMLEHDPRLPPGLLQDVRTIRRHVDLELRLIEDLVDLTRISVGKLRLLNDPVDVHQVLKEAVQVCDGDLRDKELELTTQLMADDAMIVGDAVRLQQVFWNLLRNAIKFTPPGGAVSIATSREGAQISIRISDTGIGIDPEHLSAIFEAFEQAEPDIQVRFGGLGLGLAICQALIQGLGGSIMAASEGKGRGAAFTVKLPARMGIQRPAKTMPSGTGGIAGER